MLSNTFRFAIRRVRVCDDRLNDWISVDLRYIEGRDALGSEPRGSARDAPGPAHVTAHRSIDAARAPGGGPTAPGWKSHG
jgi:hypothetical protein